MEDLQDAMCVVLCNLKPKKLAGHMSHGMVLCGENVERTKAELLKPPQGCKPGDLITFAGYERKPPQELHPKKNPWDNVQPKLKVNDKGFACYEDIPFMTEHGAVTSKTVTNGVIH